MQRGNVSQVRQRLGKATRQVDFSTEKVMTPEGGLSLLEAALVEVTWVKDYLEQEIAGNKVTEAKTQETIGKKEGKSESVS